MEKNYLSHKNIVEQRCYGNKFSRGYPTKLKNYRNSRCGGLKQSALRGGGGGGGLEVGYRYFLGLHNWVAMHDDLVILHWSRDYQNFLDG